jgi:hypothetical protein
MNEQRLADQPQHVAAVEGRGRWRRAAANGSINSRTLLTRVHRAPGRRFAKRPRSPGARRRQVLDRDGTPVDLVVTLGRDFDMATSSSIFAEGRSRVAGCRGHLVSRSATGRPAPRLHSGTNRKPEADPKGKRCGRDHVAALETGRIVPAQQQRTGGATRLWRGGALVRHAVRLEHYPAGFNPRGAIVDWYCLPEHPGPVPRVARMGAGAISAGRPLLNHALVIYSCDQQLPECRTCRGPTQKGSSPCPRRASHILVNAGFLRRSDKELMFAFLSPNGPGGSVSEEQRGK